MITYTYLRFLSLVYIFAFWSLGTQILALIGYSGVLPVDNYLKAANDYWGSSVFWHVPTICWVGHGDDILLMLCFLGAACSVLLFFGILPAVNAFIAWMLYLSLTVVGQDFMGFQWENLLLEAGFISIFLYPFCVKVGSEQTPPSKAIIWLLRLLLFKLMFQSGLVKLLSNDPSWRDLSALTYHYYTQPLPNPISWYFHQTPLWFHQASCALMFFIELVVPFFIFAGRRARRIAFIALIAFQAIIILTGNYGFFNLLTMTLCLTLLEDVNFKTGSGPKEPLAQKIVTTIIAVMIGLLSLFQAMGMARHHPPKFIARMLNTIEPLRSINNYGLFAVMTKERNEIILEGSNDGLSWKAYEFNYKPGDLTQPPQWAMPNQPRLDWQMWFAALGRYQDSPWLINTMARLLDGSKQVEELFKVNPFKYHRPKYIRASMYTYHFTTMDERKTTLNWWKREYRGLFIPAISLSNAPKVN